MVCSALLYPAVARTHAHTRTLALPISHTAVFLKFVADRPSDLSSGTLYAAKFSNQRAGANGRPTWDLTWIKMAHGEIELCVTQLVKLYAHACRGGSRVETWLALRRHTVR